MGFLGKLFGKKEKPKSLLENLAEWTGTTPTKSEPPSKAKKPSSGNRIELPDVAAEYAYIERLTCQSCKGPTSSHRRGASGPENGRMIDHWIITCKRCGKTKQVDILVPAVDDAALIEMLLGMKKE